MYRNIFVKIRDCMILLCIGALLGVAGLYLVYCIPTAPMKEHIRDSIPMIKKEFEHFNVVEGYPGSLPGNFTDCLMLEHAVYDPGEHTVLEQILNMYRGESSEGDGWAPGHSLMDYLEGKEQPREVEYARYWHGYLLVLKPLLYMTSVNSIRVMSSAIQLILVGLVVSACGRRREFFLGTAFLLSIPFLYYFSLYTSLSLSICFYLTMGLILVQLKADERIRNRGGYGEFFLIAGMLTAYFDFLTYPLITLGFPLCICMYLDKKGEKLFQKVLCYSAEWGIGYLGYWALKWVIADILTGSHVILNGLQTIFIRNSSASGQNRVTGFFSVLKQNISVYCNWGFFLLAAGIGIWLLCVLWKQRKNRSKHAIAQSSVFIWIAAYPFLWFLLVQNHSEQHWMYTCKILSVTVFALICSVGRLCNKQG